MIGLLLALNVLCIGDSLTNPDDGVLPKYCTQAAHTVTNIAVGGTTAQGWNSSRADSDARPVLEAGGIDVVTILLGANDNGIGRSQAQFKADIEGIISQCKGWDATADYMLLAPAYTAVTPATIDLYAVAIEQICAADADVFCGFDTRTLPRSFFPDLIHPNTEGHALMRDGYNYHVVPEPGLPILTAAALLSLAAIARSRASRT